MPHIYPPGRVTEYPGKRVELERCPVLFVTPDLSVVARYAKQAMPYDALEATPPPFLEALELFNREMDLRENLRIKEAYRGNS
jgi:hypothetical protein